MRNIHRIYSTWDKSRINILKNFGIIVELGYDSFTIEENEVYLGLKPFLDSWEIKDYVISKFSEAEEDNAKNLVFSSNWANGYPMPDSDFGYRKTTYDDSEYCKTCGMGLKQREPFRLKKVPNWSGNKNTFSLNWVFDELFVKKELYENLFKRDGIKSEKVLLYKKETVIEDTVQLIIPDTNVSLNLENYPYTVCQICGRKRFDLINKGFFPSFKEEIENIRIFKSKEWFGTGANARKYIFVSQSLRKEFIKHKIKADYFPCE